MIHDHMPHLMGYGLNVYLFKYDYIVARQTVIQEVSLGIREIIQLKILGFKPYRLVFTPIQFDSHLRSCSPMKDMQDKWSIW